MDKPKLTIDLNSANGNVFMVIGYARELLTGHKLEHFNADIRAAIAPDAHTKYEDILAIIDKYVDLEDSSGTYPDYSVCPESTDAEEGNGNDAT